MAWQYVWALSGATLLVAVPSVHAQQNRLSILQDGSGNQLTVDQAGATNSRIGGLTFDDQQTSAGQLVLSDPITGGGVPQFSQIESDGKTIQVPIVVGATELSAKADLRNGSQALQRGFGNSADITLTGDSGFVGLLQNNSSGGLSNNAVVTLDGNGTALVSQQGSGNGANLSVSGPRAVGAILQQGSGNDVDLTVAGADARGTISQLGSNNTSSLAVVSANGASVSYTLQGSGITNFNPLQGVDVTTNAASVSITQTAIGAR